MSTIERFVDIQAWQRARELSKEICVFDEILTQMHRRVINRDITAKKKVELRDRIGETDYHITDGANERIQLDALIASLCLALGKK